MIITTLLHAYYEVPVGFEPIPNHRSLIHQTGLMYLMLVPSPYYLMVNRQANIKAEYQKFVQQHQHDKLKLNYQFSKDYELISGSAIFVRPKAHAPISIFNRELKQSSIEIYTADGSYELDSHNYSHNELTSKLLDQQSPQGTDILEDLNQDRLLFNPDDLHISEIQLADFTAN